MFTTKRMAAVSFALWSLSLSHQGWSDDPRPVKEIATGVFQQERPAEKSRDKNKPVSEQEEPDSGESKKSPDNPTKREVPDYRVNLASGETIDVGEIFRPEIDDFQVALRKRTRRSQPPMIRLFHDSGEQPFLLAERRGKVLHGLFATYTKDGSPVAHTSYEKGSRSSTLLTWDDSKRPLVFAQYDNGKLDGVRCLFRGCCDVCADGHPWLVQHWKDGNLYAAHLVLDDDSVKTFTYHGDPQGKPYGGTTSELDTAMLALEKFEKRLSNDEQQLKLLAARSYNLEKQRKQLETQRRNYQLASLFRSAAYPPARVGGAMAVG